MGDWTMQRPTRLCLALILVACSPEIVAVGETAGSTTSPGGETHAGNTTDEGQTTLMESESDETSEPPSDDGFVPDDDDAASDSCDPFVQDCPAGEKCVPYASTGGTWDDDKCVPILGEGQVGQACTYAGVVEATDTCDASSHCWDVQEIDGQLVGTCTAFCTGTADEPICAEGTSCVIANGESISLCIATCDPAAPDCPEGMSCVWSGNAFNCFFTQGTQPGDPCDMISSCGPGFECMHASVLPECPSSACCTQVCSLSNPVCDWEGTECVSLWEDPPPGFEDVGVCIVPQG